MKIELEISSFQLSETLIKSTALKAEERDPRYLEQVQDSLEILFKSFLDNIGSEEFKPDIVRASLMRFFCHADLFDIESLLSEPKYSKIYDDNLAQYRYRTLKDISEGQ